MAQQGATSLAPAFAISGSTSRTITSATYAMASSGRLASRRTIAPEHAVAALEAAQAPDRLGSLVVGRVCIGRSCAVAMSPPTR